VEFEQQPDNSTRIVDHDNRYAVVLSADWLAIPADAETLKGKAESFAESDPEMAGALKYTNMLKNDSFRVIAFNQSDDYRGADMMTNLLILSDEDKISSSLPLDFLVKANVDQVTANISTATVLSQGVAKNKNGLEYGYLEIETIFAPGGNKIQVHQTIFFFKADTRLTFFTLTMPVVFADSSKGIVQEVIDSVELLEE
jgi:hypothetical protein